MTELTQGSSARQPQMRSHKLQSNAAKQALGPSKAACLTAGLLAFAFIASTPLAQAQVALTDAKAVNSTTPGPEPDLSRYVSPNLETSEWELMNSVIKTLPRAMKEKIAAEDPDSFSMAVVEGGTGKIHYSRPEEAGSFEVIDDPSPLPGDEHPFAAHRSPLNHADLASSDSEAAPETTNPGVYSGSGPYRRIYTKPVPAAPLDYLVYASDYIQNAYYQQSGDVTIHCAAGNLPAGVGDLGYSYLGGWSGNWAAFHDYSAVDAGLQYNLNASEASDDDYSMFLKVAGKKIISQGNGKSGIDGSAGLPVPPHVVCNDKATVALTFGVLGAGQLRSIAPACWTGTGTATEFIGFPIASCSTYALFLEASTGQFNGTIGKLHVHYIVWVAPSISDGGWADLKPFLAGVWHGKNNVKGFVVDATCGGCMFKWMTSIAQKKQDLTDGSSYAAKWNTHLLSAYAEKLHSNKLEPLPASLANCSEFPLWTPPYSSNYAADCKDSPAATKGASAPAVAVTGYSTGAETDAITLK